MSVFLEEEEEEEKKSSVLLQSQNTLFLCEQEAGAVMLSPHPSDWDEMTEEPGLLV